MRGLIDARAAHVEPARLPRSPCPTSSGDPRRTQGGCFVHCAGATDEGRAERRAIGQEITDRADDGVSRLGKLASRGEHEALEAPAYKVAPLEEADRERTSLASARASMHHEIIAADHRHYRALLCPRRLLEPVRGNTAEECWVQFHLREGCQHRYLCLFTLRRGRCISVSSATIVMSHGCSLRPYCRFMPGCQPSARLRPLAHLATLDDALREPSRGRCSARDAGFSLTTVSWRALQPPYRTCQNATVYWH
jgi:hypothetical protein